MFWWFAVDMYFLKPAAQLGGPNQNQIGFQEGTRQKPSVPASFGHQI